MTSALLAKGVLQKNLGQTYVAMGLPRAARHALDQANQHFTTYTERPDKAGDVWLYQAETQRLLALTYESIQETEQALRAWGTAEGFALAFVDSPFCQTQSSLTNADCFLAQKWMAEAREHSVQ